MSDNEMIRRGEVLAIVGPMQWSNSPIAAVAAGDAYRAIAAIPAAPAPTVKVNPLVWELLPDRDADFPKWFADTGIGKQYHAFKAWWGLHKKWAYCGIDGFHHTLEDAKAAAQADYEARILAAIKVTP